MVKVKYIVLTIVNKFFNRTTIELYKTKISILTFAGDQAIQDFKRRFQKDLTDDEFDDIYSLDYNFFEKDDITIIK